MSAAGTDFPTRHAYRRTDVRDLFGASLHAIDRAIREGRVRVNRYGRGVYLHPGDVERTFGFPSDGEKLQVSAESLAEMEDLLA